MLTKTKNILDVFLNRYYLKYHNESGTFISVEGFYDENRNNDVTVKVVFRDAYSCVEYSLFIWLDETIDELHILNERGEEITDYADENFWSTEDLYFIKFGICS